MRFSFAKYEGLGNDFIVVEADALPALEVAQAVRLCDRHLGIGADGVLLVSERSGRPRMQVINADGSVPEMCGNGIRCVALHLARSGRAPADALEIDTDAGPHRCLVEEAGERGVIEVSMRPASLSPDAVPVRAPAPLRDAPLAVGDRTLQVTAVSMGNPHAVVFDDVGDARFALAPLLQRAPEFPRGVNVGFARMHGSRSLELWVFERGAGWTQACGTGACAAAVAAVETGRAPRGQALSVQLPGGTLSITVGAPDARIAMTGPASHVFDGEIRL